MIGICMTYFNRQEQLNKTLESFKKYDPKDFFVVIVDDASPIDIILTELSFEVKIIKMRDKTWTQGDPAYNSGFKYALSKNPDIVIIQNAECFHLGDILGYAKRVTDEVYVSFGCYSQGQGEEPGSIINDIGATWDGQSAWYNHPIHRPKPYHYCCAITAKNLIKLNGFDERFSFGAGYDDDYFLHQIRCLGLRIETNMDAVVAHQWHQRVPYPSDEGTLLGKNESLFLTLIKENNYRAQHILTPDL